MREGIIENACDTKFSMAFAFDGFLREEYFVKRTDLTRPIL